MAPKIVSFQDSAAYIYERAMKRRRDGRETEALELLRKAVERDPGHRGYRLELAEMYTEMDMPVLSNRILLELLSEPDPAPDGYYMLAVNDVSLGDEDNALRALEAYRRRVDEERYAAAADEIYGALNENTVPGYDIPRRKARALRNAVRAGNALADSDGKAVRAIIEHGRANGEAMPETEAVYAMALTQIGEEDEAISIATSITQRQDAQAHELGAAAQILWLCGLRDEAESAIRRAINLRPMGLTLITVIQVLIQMDLREELAEQCRLALQETPYDRHLLGIRAAALQRNGAEAEAIACWKRIQQLDSEDATAAYHLNNIREGKAELPEYEHLLPENAKQKMRYDITKALLSGRNPNEQQEARKACVWALAEGDARTGVAAAALLVSDDDSASVNRIREFFYRKNVSAQVRGDFRELVISQGKDPERYFPPEELDPGTGLSPMRDVLAELPAYERQLIRYADDVLHADYSVSAGAELAQLWINYIEREGGNRFNSIKEAAAALAWNYFLSVNVRPSVRDLAEKFECAPRRMVYYAKHMAAVLEESVEHEDH